MRKYLQLSAKLCRPIHFLNWRTKLSVVILFSVTKRWKTKSYITGNKSNGNRFISSPIIHSPLQLPLYPSRSVNININWIGINWFWNTLITEWQKQWQFLGSTQMLRVKLATLLLPGLYNDFFDKGCTRLCAWDPHNVGNKGRMVSCKWFQLMLL